MENHVLNLQFIYLFLKLKPK